VRGRDRTAFGKHLNRATAQHWSKSLAKLKSPKSQLDRIRETSPRYARLLQRYADLTARQDELNRQIGGNVTTHSWTTDRAGNIVAYKTEESLGAEAGRHHSWASEAQPPKPAEAPKVRVGAVELLGDLIEPREPEPVAPAQPKPAWHREDLYRNIGREQADIADALQMLTPEIEAARKEHSARIGAALAADHTRVVEDLVDAANAFGDKLIAYANFINEQRLAGVERRYFRALNFQSFDVSESHHPLQLLIADAVEKRHVSAEKRPAWKMPAPIELLHL
jgi:hypothetical protein